VVTSRESQHQKDLERLKNFRLLDDEFMSKVFDGEIEATELILRIILEDENIRVQEVTAQYEIKNLQGRSIRLDIKATDSNNRIFDVEIQRADKGAIAERARFNSSIIDANQLRKKQVYTELKDSFVIFFTENDVLNGNLPIYHIERVIQETGKLFNDGEHIIYVNGSYKSDTPLGKLVHDFNCTNANDMYYEKLAERVKYFKETKKGVETMCKAMELMRDESLLQGKIYGIIEASRDNGKTDAQIIAYIVAKYTSLSEKDAQKYIDEYNEV